MIWLFDSYFFLLLNHHTKPGAGNVFPTNDYFSLDTDARYNTSNDEHIAYCWHSVPGYSSIGSYTGNGSTDGAFVYTGFKPAYVLIKRLTSESWIIADSARNPYNPISNYLIADGSGQEGSGINYEFLSNGIKFRAASQNETDSYIYMAFAEQPYEFATSR